MQNNIALSSNAAPIPKKGRPSLLLDPLEAADVDLETIYQGAQNGLLALTGAFPGFESFETSLFSVAMKESSRKLKSKSENEDIDKVINSFIELLSPFFMEKSAHLVSLFSS